MPLEIKLIVTDIDGVWTDGGLYYDNLGNEFKKFNVHDGAVIKLLKILEIPVCIVTAKTSEIVKRRAKELKIEHLFQGIENKYSTISTFCQNANIGLNEVAYIGDDFNDIKLLKNVKISAAPADASQYVQNEVTWILNKKGGEGAFREFVEKILAHYNTLDSTVKSLLDTLD